MIAARGCDNGQDMTSSSGSRRAPAMTSCGTSAQTSVRTLDGLVEEVNDLRGVRFSAIEGGDWLVLRTRNSTYALAPSSGGEFVVAGGWFAAHEMEKTPVRVLGCTWGGHALHTGLVAAVGMCVEFSNGVRTTRIREVRHIRGGDAGRH